jgi:hypothetical protein
MGNTARLIRLVRFDQAKTSLPVHTLFHAGPPYRGAPPEAVLTAAAQAAVIGGLAPDLASARGLIAARSLQLRPAQDFGLAAPLAQVVAPSMWCFEVGDDTGLAYAPVSEGPPPALRFGSDDPGCITRARDWCAELAAAINPMLASHALDPEKIMRDALAAGDDCHGRTVAGTNLFANCFPDLNPQLKADVLGNAGFSLSIWMAWCAWKIRSSGSPIAAIGGNGIEFGLRVRGEQTWKTVPATAPTGTLFQPERAAQALGAIGDSALVDACGFGGQALRHAPTLAEEWRAVLPADALTRPERILDPVLGIVDPALVRASNTVPIINLAILDRAGAGSPIGRGVYYPPISLFDTGDPE